MTKAVAYYRTSSAAGVGGDKDSETRQQAAVLRHAEANGITVVRDFYDAAVSGADLITERDGFNDLMDFVAEAGITIILVETVNRFARDVLVQLLGYKKLKDHGIRLVPVDDPDHFDNIEDNPMAEAIMIIMATLSMLDKKMLCKRMKSGIEKKRALTGRCEGRKPAPDAAIQMARELRAKGQSLRSIASVLALNGFTVMETDKETKQRVPTGRPYGAQSVKVMLK